MTTKTFFDKLFSFLNCFEPREHKDDTANSVDYQNITEKVHYNHNDDEFNNQEICIDVNKCSVPDKRFCEDSQTTNTRARVDVINQNNIDDLYNFIDETKNNKIKQEVQFKEDLIKKDKLNSYLESIKNSELFIFFHKTPPEEIIDEGFSKLLVKDFFITEEEKENIHFSKKGLMILFNNLMMNQDFKQFFDKNNLKLSYKKNGSILTEKFILGKAIYKMNKNTLNSCITLENIIEMLYDFEVRKSWDQSIKDIIVLEKDENSTIYNMIVKSPGFLIAERDVLDKRIEFYHDGIYYNFNSSIKENKDQKPQKDVVRCRTFMNIFIITQDEEYFHFLGLSQLDIKMPFPDSLINMILAPKVQSFYNSLVEELNKRYR